MSEVKRCTLCGGQADSAGMNGEVPLAKCRECGNAYADVPDSEIEATNRCGEETIERYRRLQSSFDLAWFDWLVARFPGRDVLDIGCGNGVLLRRYQRTGSTVVGVDPAPWAQTDDYQVFTDIDQAPPDFYDVVMCTSVLEHVPDPTDMVKRALAKARPGGVVYMSVPNFASWSARCQAERMRPQEAPFHCNFFRARDLRYICEQAGARSYHIRSYGMPLAWDFWRKHRLKVTTPAASATLAPTTEPKTASPTWKHHFVVRAYYWAGLIRGDKLEFSARR